MSETGGQDATLRRVDYRRGDRARRDRRDSASSSCLQLRSTAICLNTPTTSLSLSLGVSWSGWCTTSSTTTALRCCSVVDRVYKGEAGPLIEVRTHAQESRLRDRPRRHGRGRRRRQDVARRPVRQSVRLDGHCCRAPRRVRRGPVRPTTRSASRTRATIRACSRSCSSQVPPRFSRPAQSHGTDDGRTGGEALQTATGPDRRTSRMVPATAALPSQARSEPGALALQLGDPVEPAGDRESPPG